MTGRPLATGGAPLQEEMVQAISRCLLWQTRGGFLGAGWILCGRTFPSTAISCLFREQNVALRVSLERLKKGGKNQRPEVGVVATSGQ